LKKVNNFLFARARLLNHRGERCPVEKRVESFKPAIVEWSYREGKEGSKKLRFALPSYLCNRVLIPACRQALNLIWYRAGRGVIRGFPRNLKGERDAARIKKDSTQQMAS
jgi:hypothetical protein